MEDSEGGDGRDHLAEITALGPSVSIPFMVCLEFKN